MVWQQEVDEIERRRALAAQMGGEQAVARHHAKGELTARERLAALLDEGSFREYGVLSGRAEYGPEQQASAFTPSNAVIGIGVRHTMTGRPHAG